MSNLNRLSLALFLAFTTTHASWATGLSRIGHNVAFNNDPFPIETASVELQSALSTAIRLERRGHVLVTTGADDIYTGVFCEISIGYSNVGSPDDFTEVPAARKTYLSQDSLLSNTYVVGPLPKGEYVLHFLFKSNAGGVCSIRQRTIAAVSFPGRGKGIGYKALRELRTP